MVHFASQIALQSTAFDRNLGALNSLTTLVANKTLLNGELPIMQGSVLKFCTKVPQNLNTNGCTVIWNGTSLATGSAANDATDSAQPTTNRHPDAVCQRSLVWPISELKNQKREDITFLAFQLWVLGMSIIALLNESIPHIFASLLTHMMSTAWAVYQITNTAKFHSNFRQVILQNTCNGFRILSPTYWTVRANAEMAGLILNAVALLISCYLTWRLTKLFGWQTFKRIGASLVINRIYRLMLVLSIAIQLCLFFIAVTVSLWIDQLINKPTADQPKLWVLYVASSTATLTLLLPWLIMGWVGVRRELKLPMFLFLLLSLLYIGCWSIMLDSTTFRWTFITWRFFSVMASASFVLTCVCLVLGTICRCNFGKGLLRYLNPAEYGDNYRPNGLDEKHYYPDNQWVVPAPPFPVPQFERSQDLEANVIATLPPRSDSLRRPPRAHEHRRDRSDFPLLASGPNVSRSTSSSSSNSSDSSYSSHSAEAYNSRRWVIE